MSMISSSSAAWSSSEGIVGKGAVADRVHRHRLILVFFRVMIPGLRRLVLPLTTCPGCSPGRTLPTATRTAPDHPGKAHREGEPERSPRAELYPGPFVVGRFGHRSWLFPLLRAARRTVPIMLPNDSGRPDGLAGVRARRWSRRARLVPGQWGLRRPRPSPCWRRCERSAGESDREVDESIGFQEPRVVHQDGARVLGIAHTIGKRPGVDDEVDGAVPGGVG